MSAGILTTYTLPVESGPTATDYRHREFAVERVEWRTYLYDGEAYRIVTAYSVNCNNTSWHVDREEIPEWVPKPPEAWFMLADDVAAQAAE